MVKLNVQETDSGLDEEAPDLFAAAIDDNVGEMQRAIEAGQSLDDYDYKRATTPLHLACAHRSQEFLLNAVHFNFNPWVRDRNQRLAIDHAIANGLRETAEFLRQKMYSSEWDPDNVVSITPPGVS